MDGAFGDCLLFFRSWIPLFFLWLIRTETDVSRGRLCSPDIGQSSLWPIRDEQGRMQHARRWSTPRQLSSWAA